MQTDNSGLTYVSCGNPQQIRVEPDPEKLALYGVTLQQLVAKVRDANRSFQAGSVRDNDTMRTVAAGQTLAGIPDIGLLLVTTRDNRPVYVRDVAKVVIGPSPQEHRVWMEAPEKNGRWDRVPAVSVAFAKRSGANAVVVAEDVVGADQRVVEPTRIGGQDHDPHGRNLGVDVGIMDDLAGQEDAPFRKLHARLVRVFHGALNAVAEAEFLRQAHADPPRLERVLTAAQQVDELARVVTGQRVLHLGAEAEPLAEVHRIGHGRKVSAEDRPTKGDERAHRAGLPPGSPARAHPSPPGGGVPRTGAGGVTPIRGLPLATFHSRPDSFPMQSMTSAHPLS